MDRHSQNCDRIRERIQEELTQIDDQIDNLHVIIHENNMMAHDDINRIARHARAIRRDVENLPIPPRFNIEIDQKLLNIWTSMHREHRWTDISRALNIPWLTPRIVKWIIKFLYYLDRQLVMPIISQEHLIMHEILSASENENSKQQTNAVKRKRGRPPGSKNSKKGNPAQASGSVAQVPPPATQASGSSSQASRSAAHSSIPGTMASLPAFMVPTPAAQSSQSGAQLHQQESVIMSIPRTSPASVAFINNRRQQNSASLTRGKGQ